MAWIAYIVVVIGHLFLDCIDLFRMFGMNVLLNILQTLESLGTIAYSTLELGLVFFEYMFLDECARLPMYF